MTNNLNWFESPLPKASNYNHLPLFRGDADPDNEEVQWKSISFYSPQSFHSSFKINHAHPASPWSNFLHENEVNRENSLSIPGLVSSLAQKEDLEQKLVFSQDEEENEEDELITPIREITIKEDHSEGELHTTGKKSEAEIASSARKSRPREKGLRKLSQRAFQIVQDLKNVTYKDVAAKLVQQLNDDQFESENKQEQNIKRRVYDALNVLIALGVLRKDGRKIVSDRASKQAKYKQSSDKYLEILKRKVVSKQEAVEEKRKELKLTEQKRREIAYLMGRNKQSCLQQKEKVFFPFIGVFCSAEEIENLSLIKSNYFVFRSQSAMQPFGDMDCLKIFKRCSEDHEQTSQF